MPVCANWLLKARANGGQNRFMAQNWTSRIAVRASKWSGVFRTTTRAGGVYENDADARRMRIELDAIRARFPDHS